MRLIGKIILFLIVQFFGNASPILGQSMQRKLQSIEGIIIYCSEFQHDSIPQDVVFIPYKLDKKLPLLMNIKNCLEKDTNQVGHFMSFDVMRHTQPFINDFLEICDTTFNNDEYLITASLKYACTEMPKVLSESLSFPTLIENFNRCETKVSAGVFLFEKFNKNEGKQTIRHLSLIIGDSIYGLKYERSYRYLSQKLIFLPVYR